MRSGRRNGLWNGRRIGLRVVRHGLLKVLNMGLRLSGKLLIEKQTLLPLKFNLSLRLSLLLLGRVEVRITSTDKITHATARMLRSRTCY